jgi:hypothetical protein
VTGLRVMHRTTRCFRAPDFRILGVDPLPVLLDLGRRDLRGHELAEGRGEVRWSCHSLCSIVLSRIAGFCLRSASQSVASSRKVGSSSYPSAAFGPGLQRPSWILASSCSRARSSRASSQPSRLLPSGIRSSLPRTRTRRHPGGARTSNRAVARQGAMCFCLGGSLFDRGYRGQLSTGLYRVLAKQPRDTPSLSVGANKDPAGGKHKKVQSRVRPARCRSTVPTSSQLKALAVAALIM